MRTIRGGDKKAARRSWVEDDSIFVSGDGKHVPRRVLDFLKREAS